MAMSTRVRKITDFFEILRGSEVVNAKPANEVVEEVVLPTSCTVTSEGTASFIKAPRDLPRVYL